MIYTLGDTGYRLTIQLMNEGTSSEMLLGRDWLVTNRGMLPAVSLATRRRTSRVAARGHLPLHLLPVDLPYPLDGDVLAPDPGFFRTLLLGDVRVDIGYGDCLSNASDRAHCS